MSGVQLGLSMDFSASVADAVASEGVTDLFGVIGFGTIRVTHYLVNEHDVVYHSLRHEGGALASADGYARATGGVGVAVTSWGPGFTNALTSLITAKRAGSSVVYLLAENSTFGEKLSAFSAGTQVVDHAGLLGAISVPYRRATPESVGARVTEAFELARASRTPVVLFLPMEYATVGTPVPVPQSSRADRAGTEPSASGPTNILAAADLLRRCRKPVIIAGRGAVGAEEMLTQLADRVGGLLATSLGGAGLFYGCPYNLGIAGGLSSDAATEFFDQADCLVAFGMSLNVFTTSGGRLLEGKSVIQCDVASDVLRRNEAIDIAILGDVREAASGLLAALSSKVSPPTGFREALARSGSGLASSKLRYEDMSGEHTLDPRAICARLDELLPSNRIILADSGQVALHAMRLFTATEPRSLHWIVEFGAVGNGLGTAIGAAIGRPEHLIVLVTGDGGFFMSLGDFDLVTREQIPILVVCLNDHAYGGELHHLREMDLPPEIGCVESAELAGITRAMGAESENVSRMDQLASRVSDWLARRDGPLFLDCQIARNVPSNPIRVRS